MFMLFHHNCSFMKFFLVCMLRFEWGVILFSQVARHDLLLKMKDFESSDASKHNPKSPRDSDSLRLFSNFSSLFFRLLEEMRFFSNLAHFLRKSWFFVN